MSGNNTRNSTRNTAAASDDQDAQAVQPETAASDEGQTGTDETQEAQANQIVVPEGFVVMPVSQHTPANPRLATPTTASAEIDEDDPEDAPKELRLRGVGKVTWRTAAFDANGQKVER